MTALAVLALALPPSASAREALAPGLVYERLVRPGPVVAHVLRLDRYPARRAAPDGALFRVNAVAAGPLA